MAGWIIDCVWSNGIKRQQWPSAGHSGGDGGNGSGLEGGGVDRSMAGGGETDVRVREEERVRWSDRDRVAWKRQRSSFEKTLREERVKTA